VIRPGSSGSAVADEGQKMEVLTRQATPDVDPGSARDSRRRRLGLASTVTAVVVFAAVIGLAVWFIHRYAVNMVYFDQWTDISLIQKAYSGTLSFSAIWAQHNENRVFVPNLIVLALAYTTHFDIVVEDYLCGAFLGVTATFLIVAHRRRASWPWIYYCPVAILLVGYVPLNDALFGYQIGWFLVLVGLAGALFWLDRYTLSRLAMAGAIVAGFVGSFSAIEGLFIWPTGLVLLYLRRRPAWTMVVWIVSGAIAGALYFWHFQFAAAGGNKSYVLDHPFAAVKFFFGSIGNVIATSYPTSSPTVGNDLVSALGILVFAIAVWALVVGFRRGLPGGSALGVSLICFGLIFDVFTTLGRSQLGLSTGGRYSVFALMIWIGCYLTLAMPIPRLNEQERSEWLQRLDRWTRVKRSDDAVGSTTPRIPPIPRRTVVNAVALGGLLVLMVIQFTVGFGAGLADANGWHGQELTVADVTANIDQATDGVVSGQLGQYPPSYIRPLAAFARAQHLSLFDTPLAPQLADEGLYPSLLTAVVYPKAWSVLSGSQFLDAFANTQGISSVEIRATGGTLDQRVVAKAQRHDYGWVVRWDTTRTANGIYSLQSVVNRVGRSTIYSLPVKVFVYNH
jgi:hypothetical protein